MNGKRWGRRSGATIAAVTLITIAYYIAMIKGLDIAWWLEYAKIMAGILIALIGGLSLTDSISASKKKDDN